ncbi:MAG: acyl-CoA/acyl-ACP dehydrogenase [Actinomycetota bacterium]|nr:acyl-CoA/acyl-ACP dehydrogenase [Actinomycetota bacterium]
MDFSISDTQQELAALARQILTDQVTQTRLRAVEQAGEHFDRDLWRSLADAGILSAALPASLGGGGLDVLEQASLLIEFGRAVAPVPYLTSIAVCAAAIGRFGDDAQRAAWGEPAARGQTCLAAALAEDLVDSPEAPITRAERTGNGWVLSGAKAVVPAATIAEAFLVPANTDEGVAVFIVRRDDPGLAIEPQTIIDGDVVASLELTGLELGADRRLGGFEVLDYLITRATLGQCALQLGILERALELTVAYAREREQFGRPIGSFQAVGQRLADAYIDVEAVRLTMWEAAWRVSEGLPAAAELATAKFWAADAGHRVAHTAVHVHGGTGIDLDGPLHRYFVAAKRGEFVLGSATVHLRRLGAELAAIPA